MDYQERFGRSIGLEESQGLCEQAVCWVDTLEDSLRDGDRRKFFEWLKESPKHVEELLMAIALNDSLFEFDYRKHGFSLRVDNESQIVDLRNPIAPRPHRIPKSGARRRVRYFAAAAAVLLLAITGIMQLIFSGRSVNYQSSIGEIRRVTLSDGSQVVLNTDSAVTVRFTRDSRLINLQRGEVDFDVASDPRRPFDVMAGGTVVRALGTRFSLRLTPSQRAEVIVSSGRVAIHRAKDDARLTELSRNERAVISHGSITMREHLPPTRMAQTTMWLHGRLNFSGETIAEAADEFNRYSKRRILITDKDAGERRVWGTFAVTEADDFVESLLQFGLAPVITTSEFIILDSNHATEPDAPRSMHVDE